MAEAKAKSKVALSVSRKEHECIGFGISWERQAHKPVDMDLQAVIVNNDGVIVDAVFYNNLSAIKSAVQHSGDEQTGERAGFDEVIWVHLPELPETVKMLVFVVAVYNEHGKLSDALDGICCVLGSQGALLKFALEQSDGKVDPICTLVRRGDGAQERWEVSQVEFVAKGGQHFMDILEPTLGNIIRQVIPQAPTCKFWARMNKGSIVDVPQLWENQTCRIGLGWELAVGKDGKPTTADLNVAAVLYDDSCQPAGLIDKKHHAHGTYHSGDNKTGAGDGDDEFIEVELSAVPHIISQFVFIVNVRTKQVRLNSISSAYCRFVGGKDLGTELGRIDFVNCKAKQGLVVCRLMRDRRRKRWSFQMIGSFVDGRHWRESLPFLNEVCKTSKFGRMPDGTPKAIKDANAKASKPNPKTNGNTDSVRRSPVQDGSYVGSDAKSDASGRSDAEDVPEPVSPRTKLKTPTQYFSEEMLKSLAQDSRRIVHTLPTAQSKQTEGMIRRYSVGKNGEDPDGDNQRTDAMVPIIIRRAARFIVSI